MNGYSLLSGENELKEIVEKKECCGCAACLNICPVGAIVMEEDEEGFLYPVINKNGKCIECRRCLEVCPVRNKTIENECEQFGYVVQNKNERVLRESTSGGAFTAIAEYVIEKGGIVYGAAFDSDLHVRHIGVTTKSELYKLRGSKYVQSEIGNCLRSVASSLQQGQFVLFSGTPCQIEGLLNYLNGKPRNLITVDIVCRAVPSPLVLKKYIEYKRALCPEIEEVRFRDKYYGYKYSQCSIYDKNGTLMYHNGIDTDEYLRAFFSNICDRPACYVCAFKKRYRKSDCTLWDCFEVDEYFKQADNDKGVTRCLIHNREFLNRFDEIKESLLAKEVAPDYLVKNVREMFESVPQNVNREVFFRDVNELRPEDLFQKYFPVTLSCRIEKGIRLIGNKMGIYRIIRRTYKRLFGDRKR